MDVIFQHKSEDMEHFRIRVDGYGKMYWKKGAYKTSDKELIKKLLRHPLKQRGEYKVVTNKELVENYLLGKEPDKLTEEMLDNVTLEGIIELGMATKATETRPNLIKIELVGQPITNRVREILDFYQKNQSTKQVKEHLEEKVETVKEDLSTDLTATQAIERIQSSSKEDIEGFIAEDEDRVTVLRAYDEKISE